MKPTIDDDEYCPRRPSPTTAQQRTMRAAVLRKPAVFRAAQGVLTPEQLEAGGTVSGYGIAWAATLELHGTLGRLPRESELWQEIDARLKGDPEFLDGAGKATLRKSLRKDFAIPAEDLDDRLATKTLKHFLADQTYGELQQQLEERETPENLSEFFSRLVEKASQAERLGEPKSGGDWAAAETMRDAMTKRRKAKYYVDGLLARGSMMLVAGPTKALKTSLLVDLTISLASGTPFLGQRRERRFAVPKPTKVWMFSGESGRDITLGMAERIAKRKGRLSLTTLPILWSWALPQLSSDADLQRLAAMIREHKIEVVIIDPLYQCLLGAGTKINAANFMETGPLLAKVSQMILGAGATPVLVHHTTKATRRHFDPPDLGDAAWAGIGESAAQWLLLNRRSPFNPTTGKTELWCSIGGRDGHGGEFAVDVVEGSNELSGGRVWQPTVLLATEFRAADQGIVPPTPAQVAAGGGLAGGTIGGTGGVGIGGIGSMAEGLGIASQIAGVAGAGFNLFHAPGTARSGDALGVWQGMQQEALGQQTWGGQIASDLRANDGNFSKGLLGGINRLLNPFAKDSLIGDIFGWNGPSSHGSKPAQGD